MTGTTYLIVVAGTRKWLPEVMAGVLDIELEPTPLPEPGPESPRSEVLDIVLSEINDVVTPALSEPSVVARVMAMSVLVMHLQTEERLGAALDEAELDDLAELLGERPATVTEGLAALDALVATAGPERDEELVRYFARTGDREAARWQAISYFFDKRIEPVDV
jgi:DNA-binding transcriptional ArsR family regulator